MLELGLKFTLAYGLGGVMGALLIGALTGGIDIRTMGSGNAGGTNALRTQGKWFALAVMTIDVGKGILALAVLPNLSLPLVGIDPNLDRDVVLFGVALAVVIGHVFPVWYGFRGGKGGATAAGVLCFVSPPLALPILGSWAAIIFVTGYVGLATIGATVALAAYLGFFELPEQRPFFIFACLVSALTIYTHRGNIVRMWQGRESRFGRYFGLGR